MQSDYPAQFIREQGFTEADWLSCLPGAVRDQPWRKLGVGLVVVELEGGCLELAWQVLTPRQIGLVRLPRLSVTYRFDASVADEARLAFMKYFDLYMQRGGG